MTRSAWDELVPHRAGAPLEQVAARGAARGLARPAGGLRVLAGAGRGRLRRDLRSPGPRAGDRAASPSPGRRSRTGSASPTTSVPGARRGRRARRHRPPGGDHRAAGERDLQPAPGRGRLRRHAPHPRLRHPDGGGHRRVHPRPRPPGAGARARPGPPLLLGLPRLPRPLRPRGLLPVVPAERIGVASPRDSSWCPSSRPPRSCSTTPRRATSPSTHSRFDEASVRGKRRRGRRTVATPVEAG